MRKIEQLNPGKYYHIFNCGINGEPLFKEVKHYEYFLALYRKYVHSVAETMAWCLMGNHFHLLVKIREDTSSTPDRVPDPVRVGFKPHLAFSHLFNAYAQAFNKQYNRHGGLFERPFKRKLIDSEEYLKQVLIYIHENPVHHGFCVHPGEYPWSSYMDVNAVRPMIRKNLALKTVLCKSDLRDLRAVNDRVDLKNTFFDIE